MREIRRRAAARFRTVRVCSVRHRNNPVRWLKLCSMTRRSPGDGTFESAEISDLDASELG